MNRKIIFIVMLFLAPLVILPLVMFFSETNNIVTAGTTSASTAEASPVSPLKTITIVTPDKSAFTREGFDWSLPLNTRITQNSGLVDEYNSGLDYARNVFAMVRWDEANPQKGQYDFSKFEQALENVSPKKTLVRLEVNSLCEAPKWAKNELRASLDKSLIFWDKQYVALLKPFVEAFAKRYANDPRIIGVQLGIADGEYNNDSCDFVNKDGWGEFWMAPENINLAQKKYGFNPDVFEKQTKAIIDIYVDAFDKNKHKLAFTNIGPIFSWDGIAKPYNLKLKNIAQYVWEKGIGNRDGHVELWMRFIDKVYGIKLDSLPDGSCSLGFDEQYANSIKGRYWGTENEFYGDEDYVIESNGPYRNQPYRFMVSSLRALQMRRNYFTIEGESMQKLKDPLYKTQDFLSYLNKVMGKQIENTPDAFVLLGERYVSQDRLTSFASEPCVKNAKNGARIRSFGRWLTEKSDSEPALLVSMPKSENYWGQDYTMPNGIDYEYSARKSNKFEFTLNDKLTQTRCKNGCELEVKITFKDTVKTDLSLFYQQSRDSHNRAVQHYVTNGDITIKTVTFTVNSHFQKSINQKRPADFVIKSKAPLSLIMTRVNFL